ncbi:MAG TPA: ATP-binding protein [Candidatus Binatia bacterium]|nr:ATP-binding protein [Candidatus Binatia bacterium]
MLNAHRALPLRYGVAAAAAGLALWLTLLLWPMIKPSVSPLFFAAVMVSAWYGGLGPGLLATALAVGAIDYFFLPPPSTRVIALDEFLRLSVFVLVALLISSLTAARKRAEEALRRAHDELETRVQARTAELAKTNEALRAEIAERTEAEAQVAQVTGELVKRNEELWRLQREMGRIEPLAALGRVTGTIAHELGTPLNSVLGYSQLLAQEQLPASARDSLRIIETQVQRMVDIIQHYLSRTRRSPQSRRQIDINELIRETLVLLNPIFHQHRVRVVTACAETLPPLSGDDASLQRVLINVLNNAVDAMEGGGTVTIATRVSVPPATGRPTVVIEVTDTGTGIPPEILPHIFELFVTTKAPGKGTGLGLLVCQEIIHRHGGTIEISSQAAEGTCVRIALPADDAVEHSAYAEGHG